MGTFSEQLRQRMTAMAQAIGAHWRPAKLALALCVALLLVPLVQPFAYAATVPTPTPAPTGHPTTYDPTKNNTSITHSPKPPLALGWKAPATSAPIGRPTHGPMADATVELVPGKATDFLGSDGRLELHIPAGAVTAADVQAAGGHLRLQITQIAPPSGASAGGWGVVSFGTYQLQLVDAAGTLALTSLHAAPTALLHYQDRDQTLNLDQTVVLFNGARPPGSPSAKAPSGIDPVTTFGAAQTSRTTRDKQHHTLAVTLPTATTTAHPLAATLGTVIGSPRLPNTLNAPSTTMTWDTFTQVAAFGSPQATSTDLTSGALQLTIPINVPAGPGSTQPNLSLTYNSNGVSQQHNPLAAAGWVGEGWNLTLGKISWAEHNVYANQTINNPNTVLWEDSWQLEDAFGNNVELVPPDINVTTYYDSSNGGTSFTTPPVTWHTAPETHAKVVEYAGPAIDNIGDTTNPPCWRVWLPSGIMEEFGCTPDALQYYPSGDSNGRRCMANWLLDLIVTPQGNQIHIAYQKDTATDPKTGLQYPRDVEPYQITYDDPGCLNTTTECTASGTGYGNQTGWNPQKQIVFLAFHTPALLTNTPAHCNTGTNLRCDNPLDLSGSGGVPAPLVQATYVLSEIDVQTQVSSAWKTLRSYKLSYEQNGPNAYQDPATGMQESTAGYLDLTQVQQFGADGSTALAPLTFSYGSQTEYYEDTTFHPQHTTFCGPSWNVGDSYTNNQCPLWSQSYDGNSRYLSGTNNGQGLGQSFTWANARNNTHGVTTGGSPADPLYCTNHQTSTSPCDVADDQNWSQMVLTSRHDYLQRSSQAGPSGQRVDTWVTSIYAYTYQLTYPLAAQECGDCVAGMYWGNQNDGDYLDFYNGKFMGFTQGSVSLPDGSMETHKFYATNGYGVYDTTQVTSCPSNLPPINTACHNSPYSAYGNALHGREYEVDHLNQDGSTFIGKTVTQYNTVCPPSGVSGTPAYPGTWGTWDGNLVSELDHNNPLMVCDIQTKQVDTYTYEAPNAQWSNYTQSTSVYTYDSYGRVTQAVATSNDGGAVGSPTTIVRNIGYVWNDSINAQQYSATGTYRIDLPAWSNIADSASSPTVHATCDDTLYDGQTTLLTGQQSAITGGLVTGHDTFTSCGTSGNGFASSGQQRTTRIYDSYGDPLTSTDGEANNGNTQHLGCTVGSTSYTACATWDSSKTLLVSSATTTRASTSLTSSLSYSTSGATTGWGLWPTSQTDPNSQVSSATYDALGRVTSTTLPSETSGLTTQSVTYTNSCNGAIGPPCLEIDSTQRLDSSTTVTARQFFDGFGHLIETRTPAPGGQDVVQYQVYDVALRVVAASIPYFVTSGTGFSVPDSNQPTTNRTSDGLGRVTKVVDPLGNTTTTSYAVNCGWAGDANCFDDVSTQDANGHQPDVAFLDAFGRTIYRQSFTGTTGNYTAYQTFASTYDLLGNPTKARAPDGTSTTTTTYDASARPTALSDPDLGSYTFTYDQNSNLKRAVDPRGSSGTVYFCYDGANRLTQKSVNSDCASPLATYNYDETTAYNSTPVSNGQGRLTSEQFVSNGVTGDYVSSYDARGRVIPSPFI